MRRLLALLAVVGMLAAASPSWAQTPAATAITTPAPTATVFSDVLASAAPGARRGCAITNIGTTQGYCNFRPGGFTPTTSNTIPVAPNGGQWFCSIGPGNTSVGQEPVSCTCASGTCAFVVDAQ